MFWVSNFFAQLVHARSPLLVDLGLTCWLSSCLRALLRLSANLKGVVRFGYSILGLCFSALIVNARSPLLVEFCHCMSLCWLVVATWSGSFTGLLSVCMPSALIEKAFKKGLDWQRKALEQGKGILYSPEVTLKEIFKNVGMFGGNSP